jgi:hypothetical protein
MMMDGKNFRTIECNCWSSEQRIKECNATDVDVQVKKKNTRLEWGQFSLVTPFP